MKPPVNVDIGAKASANISIKGEIPKGSLGRLVDSITDVFRPFSEARGLRADHIRLQREEVAIEIAKRARAKLAIEEMEPQPIDNKILIPLIEKSSLEELSNDEMIDRWSALLASAASDNNVAPRYVQILSELNGRQAKCFERIMLHYADDFDFPDTMIEDAPTELDPPFVQQSLMELIGDRETPLKYNDFSRGVSAIIDRPGGLIIDLILIEPDATMYSLDINKTPDNEYFEIKDRHKFEIDLEIIASLGLLRYSHIHFSTKYTQEIQVFYYRATDLAVDFFNSINRRKLISR